MDKGMYVKKNSVLKQKVKLGEVITLLLVVLIVAAVSVFSIRKGWVQELIHKIKPNYISSISISAFKDQLEQGEQIKLQADIQPKGYTTSELTWVSSAPDIISVEDGVAKAVSPGDATIYLCDGEVKSNKLQLRCIISVAEIRIDNRPEYITIGDDYQLQVTVRPDNATNKKITFESSQPQVAYVDNSGYITTNQIGSSRIKIRDSLGKQVASFCLEVRKRPVESIDLDDEQVTIGKGQAYILSATVAPKDASYTDVKWESSNNSIAIVDDGIIKAVGVGEATITASTDEGDKTASISLKVEADKPDTIIKYSSCVCNIRRGPGTDYETLGRTNENEAIEFLKDVGDGWYKVRTANGLTGYAFNGEGYYLDSEIVSEPIEIADSDSSAIDDTVENRPEKYKIYNVPHMNQFSLNLPTGCEAVSAAMVLRYYGYDISAMDVVNGTPQGSKIYEGNDGIWLGGNPFEEFVGDPRVGLSAGSYGCFAKPIVIAMKKIATKHTVKDISGCSAETLFQYVFSNHPVVVWGVKYGRDLVPGITWRYTDGSGSFKQLKGEHCMVLIGYDDTYVYLKDPALNDENVKQLKSKFIENWKKLYAQAIIIE